MSEYAISWDETGRRLFEAGVSNVALYNQLDSPDSSATYGKNYGNAVAWSGVSAINENPEGGEPTDVYADNIKYLTMIGVENLKGSIEAYYYPDEFEPCNGAQTVINGMVVGQQNRKGFGVVYQTKLGNDASGADFGVKLHFLYGCKVSPSDKQHSTINENPEASTMSWSFSAQTVGSADMPTVTGKSFNQCASLEVASKYFNESTGAWTDTPHFSDLLEAVYGTKAASSSTEDTPGRLLTPKEVYTILNQT